MRWVVVRIDWKVQMRAGTRCRCTKDYEGCKCRNGLADFEVEVLADPVLVGIDVLAPSVEELVRAADGGRQ